MAIQYDQNDDHEAAKLGSPTTTAVGSQTTHDGIDSMNTPKPTSIKRGAVLAMPEWRNDWSTHTKKSTAMLRITNSIAS